MFNNECYHLCIAELLNWPPIKLKISEDASIDLTFRHNKLLQAKSKTRILLLDIIKNQLEIAQKRMACIVFILCLV